MYCARHPVYKNSYMYITFLLFSLRCLNCPPKLAASDATTLLAAAVTRPDANAAALKDAYSFSSSPQIVRHRDTAASGEALRYECTDFGHGAVDNDGKPEARPALVAMLYADAPGSGS